MTAPLPKLLSDKVIEWPRCTLCKVDIAWTCRVCGEWYCRDCTIYVGSKCLHIIRRSMSVDDMVPGIDDE